LVVGLPSTTIDQAQIEVLERILPAGVILFARNIATADQVRTLTDGLDELDPRPFVAIDLEGGAVNRLESLWGPLPSPAEAAARGHQAVRALGEAAGAACRRLGIHLDLAPVVDLDRDGSALSLQGRCLGDQPEQVANLARTFHAGLTNWGVGGCLKHFPGLGSIVEDTHEKLPSFDADQPLRPHLDVFSTLAEEIPIVMVAHVVVPMLGDPERPATLSRAVVDLAADLPGGPVILSDDLEMGALDDWGDLPERVVAALRACNHGVLICKAFDRLEEIAGHIRETMEADTSFASRVDAMTARLGTLRRDLCRTSAAVPAPDDDTVAELWEKARQLGRR
jgi:beta-N-acetylhexosaminidase